VLLVADKVSDRSADLLHLANDALAPRYPPPAAPLEPLNDDRREHPDNLAQRIRHPRDVRILPRSRDFH
jgi:error-prone DNA polymerase